jgi:hypothetical protein
MILLNQADKRYRIDYSKPVKVYRNLHKGCWSIKQNGLVKAHSDEVNLFDCNFLVNEKNRQKVIKEKRKNVHAFVKGYIWIAFDNAFVKRPIVLIKQASYNPYARNSFYDVDDLVSIHKANFVRATNKKLFYN